MSDRLNDNTTIDTRRGKGERRNSNEARSSSRHITVKHLKSHLDVYHAVEGFSSPDTNADDGTSTSLFYSAPCTQKCSTAASGRSRARRSTNVKKEEVIFDNNRRCTTNICRSESAQLVTIVKGKGSLNSEASCRRSSLHKVSLLVSW